MSIAKGLNMLPARQASRANNGVKAVIAVGMHAPTARQPKGDAPRRARAVKRADTSDLSS